MNIQNQITVKSADTLPALIDRAASALASAKSSAEVLEARDYARVAYDAAKSAGRLAKAKNAHDRLLAEVYRMQGNALLIEARAKMRLAEEYDAAQDRGEVRKAGNSSNAEELTSAADIGLSHKDIFNSRKLADAEKQSPGIVQKAIDDMLERNFEPTKAGLEKYIDARYKPAPTNKPRLMDPKALWLWGRLKDFEREGVIQSDPAHLISEMTEPMRQDVSRLVPLVRKFLEATENAL